MSIKHYGLNAEYNCDINLCVEDILNLIDCKDQIMKRMKLESGVDLFTFTLDHIIKEWENKIGIKAIDINNKASNGI